MLLHIAIAQLPTRTLQHLSNANNKQLEELVIIDCHEVVYKSSLAHPPVAVIDAPVKEMRGVELTVKAMYT